MDETKNLWNKRADELTVGDSVKISVATPILVMAGMALAGGIFSAVSGLSRKIRKNSVTPTETTDEQ